MKILEMKDITALNAKESISGIVSIHSYSRGMTKGANSKPYINGKLNLKDGEYIDFKVWSNKDSSLVDILSKESLTGAIVVINATVDEYNGKKSLVVTTMGVPPEDFRIDETDFYSKRYNKEAYLNALKSIVKNNVSDKGFELASKILFDNKEICDRFSVEFAGISHHDNCLSGVLAHTYKCLCIMNTVLSMYPYLMYEEENQGVVSQSRKDLYILGMLLHDIGKIQEMNMGVYQKKSCITHRALGMEMLFPYKEDIIKIYGEDWYYKLLSICLQHSHVYEDKAKTVFAYVTFLVDNMESTFTNLGQKFSNNEITVSDAGSTIFYDSDTRVVW